MYIVPPSFIGKLQHIKNVDPKQASRIRKYLETKSGAVEKVFALVHSPPVEGWQAQPDGVVAKVLHKVTPFVLLQQTAVLFFNSPILR